MSAGGEGGTRRGCVYVGVLIFYFFNYSEGFVFIAVIITAVILMGESVGGVGGWGGR